MLCKRCGAKELKYFYLNQCRRCIHLRLDEMEVDKYCGDIELDMAYELSSYQKEVSKELLGFVQAGESVYLEAVCGAGKTEMCLELVSWCLSSGLRIGWAIPRRQVVLELGERLGNYFPGIKVVSVCGGFTDDVMGDLIICTTHQLFRYHSLFDVLIVDEPDAFPFAGNEMLEFMMNASCRGPIVYLSATLEGVPESFKRLNLSLRPSGKLLPEPIRVRSLFKVFEYLYLWRKESVLVFVPTRKLAWQVSRLLFCDHITSESKNRDEIIARFRRDGGFLVCTSVLERGVTFTDCFVIVLFSDHPVFSKSSLIQIAGRVGRGMNPLKGEVVFWERSLSDGVSLCCLEIGEHNKRARSVLSQLETL